MDQKASKRHCYKIILGGVLRKGGSKRPSEGHRDGKAQVPVKVQCDFNVRPEKERDVFTQTTWCDSCCYNNLGMLEPSEFKLRDKTYLKGKCSRCGSIIISEIIDKNISGSDVDIIWPIRDRSKPALTYLPRKSYDSHFNWGGNKFGSSPLRTVTRASVTEKIVLWIVVLMVIVVIILSVLHQLKYGS